jgi:hypothetical protein
MGPLEPSFEPTNFLQIAGFAQNAKMPKVPLSKALPTPNHLFWCLWVRQPKLAQKRQMQWQEKGDATRQSVSIFCDLKL